MGYFDNLNNELLNKYKKIIKIYFIYLLIDSVLNFI
jgi:hypothetical protein